MKLCFRKLILAFSITLLASNAAFASSGEILAYKVIQKVEKNYNEHILALSKFIIAIKKSQPHRESLVLGANLLADATRASYRPLLAVRHSIKNSEIDLALTNLRELTAIAKSFIKGSRILDTYREKINPIIKTHDPAHITPRAYAKIKADLTNPLKAALKSLKAGNEKITAILDRLLGKARHKKK